MKKTIRLSLCISFVVVSTYGANTLNTTGNVGINTTSPAAPLDVNGQIIGRADASGCSILFGGRTSDDYSQIVAFNSALTSYTGGISFAPAGVSLNSAAGGGTGIATRLFISSQGLVGIGTMDPSRQFEIASPTGSSEFVMSVGNGLANSRKWNFYVDGGSGNAQNLNLRILQDDNATTKLYAMNWQANGHVGVGFSTSLSPFAVGGNPPTSGEIAAVAPAAGISLALSDGVNNSLYVKHVPNGTFGGAATIGTDPGGTLAFASNGFTEQMRIDAYGNVGIGTKTPTQKLSVNGAIRAKEVIVDTSWSDYVFEEGYRLMPLKELEHQIKSEKHLPGIPSAKEVAENGITVGEMESKLLVKIEELTLRQIEQAKRIDALEKENAMLRNRR